MTEEKGIVKYQARDGQEVTLSFENVKKYLVSGNKEAVTNQELMYFLGVCKSRGLNPFKKDAYLIKYGNDPAAIITSVDYFRSRARAQKDCTGWKKGIVVQKEDGTLRDSAGIMLENEKLIGGFFEAQPEGWSTPFRLEVNLKGYIKKTKEGRITRFWEEDNQPTMIAKVAEGQGLRTLWPDEFQGLYEEAEIKAPTIDMAQAGNGTYSTTDDITDRLKANATETRRPAEPIKESAVPGATQPGVEPKTPKTEIKDGAEAKTDQGPQPSAWDPYTAAIRGRYVADKTDILKAELNKKGVLFTSSMTGKELHELLLDSLTPQDDDDLDISTLITEEEKEDPFAGDHHPDCNCQECQQAKAHKKMLDEKEAKRKAMYGDKPREDHEVIKTDNDRWNEDDPQKMADDPKPVSKEDLRNRYIAILEGAGKIDRSAWMKSKQQVGLMSSPNVHTMPIEKLIEWATLAQSMVDSEKDIHF